MPRVRVKVTPEPVRTIEVPQSVYSAPAQDQPEPVQPPTPTYPEPQPTIEEPYRPEDTQVSATTMPSSGIFISRRKLVLSALAVLLILGFFTAYSNREKPGDPSGTLGTSQTLPGASAEAQQYYNEISPHVELPTGEAPTVLNVSDANEVKKDNAALSDIKNGDKMLFFTKSRKLVVYRPSTNKVVAVVSLATPTSSTSSTTR